MPTYDYACADGHTSEHFRTVADRHDCPACPTCGKPTTKQISQTKTEMEYTESMGTSRAFRFPEHQVEQARKNFRSLNDGSASVRDDGSVIFRNRRGSQKFAEEWHSKM